MGPVELDVLVPGQVESRSSLVADLGGGRSLIVLSGIACPEYNAVDDETRDATWRIRLREPLRRWNREPRMSAWPASATTTAPGCSRPIW